MRLFSQDERKPGCTGELIKCEVKEEGVKSPVISL
jgi:hypothetical protein